MKKNFGNRILWKFSFLVVDGVLVVLSPLSFADLVYMPVYSFFRKLATDVLVQETVVYMYIHTRRV